ncbi:response regulator transcription factor [Pseudomonas sp. HR96]|uniref:response regulator transcription factor n=1 Tax=Pseudomonas sp. HR96 TaxID=1027966 RepID=UPI002A7503EC|nr:response regulator transcription factor [Pseudomonas sp. HR96]WPO99065.1 response regulator transcription factor [Pseudomonas sp. HR96]
MGLRTLVEREPELAVAGEVGSPLELTEWLHAHPCDLLITDYSMPMQAQQDGLRMLEYVRQHWPQLPVLVITSLVNAGVFRAILNTGVRGLIGKGSLLEELPQAIAHLRRRKLYIARAVSRELLQAGENRQDRPFVQETLSPRELEVTRLFGAGLSVSEIALAVNRSKQTVSAQKVSAMRKLGVPSDAALFIYLQQYVES